MREEQKQLREALGARNPNLEERRLKRGRAVKIERKREKRPQKKIVAGGERERESAEANWRETIVEQLRLFQHKTNLCCGDER